MSETQRPARVRLKYGELPAPEPVTPPPAWDQPVMLSAEEEQHKALFWSLWEQMSEGG